VRYNAFLGTLPRITGVLGTGLSAEVAFFVNPLVTSCLYSGEVKALFFEERGREGPFNRASFLPEAIPLIAGQPVACPRTMRLAATLAVTPSLRVRLL
jgi:hypothetical protein